MKLISLHRQLGDVVLNITTWNPVRDGHNQLISYIDLSSVDQDTKVIHPNKPIIAREAPSRARQLVQTGDVLVSTVRPNLNGVAMVDTSLGGATASTGFCVLRPNPKDLDGAYLFHWVKTPDFILDMVSKATGASYPAVSDRIILESKIPLLPIAEQKRIANLLDKAEELRSLRRQALAQLDALTQSIFLEMFGDPVANPKKWMINKLNELVAKPGDIVDGPFGSAINVKKDYIDNGEIPVIRTKNVQPFKFVRDDLKRISWEKFCGLQRSSVIPGDIILTKVGTIGNVCFFPSDFEVGVLSTTGSCRIRTDETLIQKVYLAYFLHFYRSEMMKFIAQGVQPFLNMNHIKAFKVTVPPLELQDEFCRRITSIDELKDVHNESLAHLDALFASLQHRAFRGEL